MPIIALMTDFGTTDAYVGVMKGVITTICPEAQIIDLTHAIDPHNVQHGAFTLMSNYRYFPARTIFLAVVDPGVGSLRRAIAVRAGDYIFVGPDNGLLSYVLRPYPYAVLYELTNSAYWLKSVSSTFHGRDVFAPIAAHLAHGESFDKLGTRARTPVMLSYPLLEINRDSLRGEVIHIDHYGNIVTSIGELEWGSEPHMLSLKSAFGGKQAPVKLDGKSFIVSHRNTVVSLLTRNYAETQIGDVLALIGSTGFLELSVNRGNASARLEAKLGDIIEVKLEPE